MSDASDAGPMKADTHAGADSPAEAAAPLVPGSPARAGIGAGAAAPGEAATGRGAATRMGAGGKRSMICLSCPLGCHLEVHPEESGELGITGNRCPKGLDYAREEFYSPKRVVTATCRTDSPRMRRAPVRTTRPLPVALIGELLAELYALELRPRMRAGDPVLRDFRGTGVDVVLSTDLI